MSKLSNVEVLEPEGSDGAFSSGGQCVRFIDEDAKTVVYLQTGAKGIKSGGMAAIPLTDLPVDSKVRSNNNGY